MDRWTVWHNSLPEHTKEYLKNAAIWTDSDMWKAAFFGSFIGFILGVLVVWH
jgi:hypothetical protein